MRAESGNEASTVLTVVARPASKVTGITIENGIVTVRVRARAVEGAANDAIVEALAERLCLAKSRVSIERGEHARRKRVRITGLDERAVAAILSGERG